MKRLTHKTSNSNCPSRCPIGFGSAVFCACLITACSDYKDGEDTLVAPVGSGDWSCLGSAEPDPPALPSDPGARVLYGLQLVDLATRMPFQGVTVRACALTDPMCKEPIGGGPVSASPDGIVDIPLWENFVGFLEINSMTSVPYIFHLPDDGLTTDRDFPLAMISIDSYMGLSELLGVDINPALGAIAVRAFDCAGDPAEGVKFETDTPGSIGWYFEGNFPTIERQTTDRSGLGGFVNSQPVPTNFKATLSNGTEITNKRIFVKTGWMTAGYMRPRVAD